MRPFHVYLAGIACLSLCFQTDIASGGASQSSGKGHYYTNSEAERAGLNNAFNAAHYQHAEEHHRYAEGGDNYGRNRYAERHGGEGGGNHHAAQRRGGGGHHVEDRPREVHAEEGYQYGGGGHPDLWQLKNAYDHMMTYPPSTVFQPTRNTAAEFGSHTYLKDSTDAIWHIDDRVFGEGLTGILRKAWHLDTTLANKGRHGTTYICKEFMIDDYHWKNGQPYHHEIVALASMGRLVGRVQTIVNVDRATDHWRKPDYISANPYHLPPNAKAYFFQTFIRGVPLGSIEDHFRPAVAGRIVASAKKAMREFHKRGWSHNDFHPGNVLVEKIHGDGYKVQYIDFGRTRRIERDPRGPMKDYGAFKSFMDKGVDGWMRSHRRR